MIRVVFPDYGFQEATQFAKAYAFYFVLKEDVTSLYN